MVIMGLEKLARKVKLSRKTLLKLHRKHGLPIKKLNHRWVTTNELAFEWFKENIDLYHQSLQHSFLVKEGLSNKEP